MIEWPLLPNRPLGDLAGAAGQRGVGRRVAGMARHRDERRPRGVGDREWVAVGVTVLDRGLGPPEGVGVLGVHDRDEAVHDRHVEQRERARVVGQRLVLRRGGLAQGRVPGLHAEHDRVEARDVGAVLRAERAVDAAELLHLDVVAHPAQAEERRGRSQSELVAALEPERRHVARVQEGAAGRAAVGRGLPDAGRGGRGRVEQRRRRAVAVTVRDHGRGRFGAERLAVLLRLAVGDGCQRGVARGREAHGLRRQVVDQDVVRRHHGCGVLGGARRRGHGAQVGVVLLRDRVHRLEDGEVGDGRDARLDERVVSRDRRRHDRVPVQDDVRPHGDGMDQAGGRDRGSRNDSSKSHCPISL